MIVPVVPGAANNVQQGISVSLRKNPVFHDTCMLCMRYNTNLIMYQHVLLRAYYQRNKGKIRRTRTTEVCK